MKKRIQRLVLSSLFVLSVGTIGLIIAEVSAGSLYAISCPNCSEDGGCPGSTCVCPPGRGRCQPPTQ
jgi:hypothetical protein